MKKNEPLLRAAAAILLAVPIVVPTALLTAAFIRKVKKTSDK